MSESKQFTALLLLGIIAVTAVGIGSGYIAQMSFTENNVDAVSLPGISECWVCEGVPSDPCTLSQGSDGLEAPSTCYGSQGECEQATQCGVSVPPPSGDAGCGNGIIEEGETCESFEDCGPNGQCIDCACIEDGGTDGPPPPPPPPPNLCGNGSLDAGEECDGVKDCLPDCTCDAGRGTHPLPNQNKCGQCVADADCPSEYPYCRDNYCQECLSNTDCTGFGQKCNTQTMECECDPVSLGTKCCEYLDLNGNGIIDDPEEEQISQPPWGVCGRNICVWCNTEDAICSGYVETDCADCKNPNEDGNPENDDPNWTPDPGCVCDTPNLSGCTASYCTEPYAGPCLKECTSPAELDCYVEKGSPPKRIQRGEFSGAMSCNLYIETGDNAIGSSDEGVCKPAGAYDGLLGGGTGTGGGGGGGQTGGTAGIGISVASASQQTLSQGGSSADGGGSGGGGSSTASVGADGGKGGDSGGTSSQNGGQPGSSTSSQQQESQASSAEAQSSEQSAASSVVTSVALQSGQSFSSAQIAVTKSSTDFVLSFGSSTSAPSVASSSVSSAVQQQSSSVVRSIEVVPYCGDGITQADLNEECDFGAANIPPGTYHHPLLEVCACSSGSNCKPPKSGALWAGCRWPKCGDGKVNNLLQFATGNFTNYDLIHEACDDGNTVDGDGCSADCQFENIRFSSFSSASSSSLSQPPGTGSSSSSTTSTIVVFRSSALSITLITSSEASFGDTDDDGAGDNDDGIPGNQDDDDDGDGDNDDGIPGNQDDDDDGDGDNDDGIAGNQIDDDNGDGDNDDGIAGNNLQDQEGLKDLVASAPVCGNGVLDAKEECDDSNRRDNDGCTASCLLEIGICGDGIIQKLLGEQCEQSRHDPQLPYECRGCLFASLTCGDGIVDPGEDCDDGVLNSTSPDAHCRPDCHASRCGDAILDSVELCDDGNLLNGDGCDRYCRTEKAMQDVLVASQKEVDVSVAATAPISVASQQQYQQWMFPNYPTMQQLPYQLPLAQLQPLINQRGPVGDTGPAAVAVIGAGAAAGLGWMRRRK